MVKDQSTLTKKEHKEENHGIEVQKSAVAARTTAKAAEVPLNWNKWIRQTHRWLSMAFTVAVIVNGVAAARGKYTNRLGLVAVATLALQFFTGLYLFVLPYATRWRSERRTDRTAAGPQ